MPTCRDGRHQQQSCRCFAGEILTEENAQIRMARRRAPLIDETDYSDADTERM